MSKDNISMLLKQSAAGNKQAASELLPLVYEQLRAAAQIALRSERPNHTLNATALVHESFLRLVGVASEWTDRAHFYAAAAVAMRRILVDHARGRACEKRGGKRERTPLSDFAAAMEGDPADVLALDDALTALESEDPEAAEIVRLRFYGGLSGDQAAACMGVSARKVDMLWARARAKLFRRIESQSPARDP